MNENTHYAKYLSWIGLVILLTWIIIYWIDKPMAIIVIVCRILGSFYKLIKSFKFSYLIINETNRYERL